METIRLKPSTHMHHLSYTTVGIIDWTMEELRELDQMTRKQMNIYKSLHPRSDIDRLYVLKRKDAED